MAKGPGRGHIQRGGPVRFGVGPVRLVSGALRTEETTALEPGVLDNKYYVKGLGVVVERSIKGPPESLRLVAVVH